VENTATMCCNTKKNKQTNTYIYIFQILIFGKKREAQCQGNCNKIKAYTIWNLNITYFLYFNFPTSFLRSVLPSFLPSFLPSYLSFFLPSLFVKSIFYVQYLNYLFMSVLRWRTKILWCSRSPWCLFRLQVIFYLKSLLSVTDVHISCCCTCSKHVYIPDVSNLDWLVHSTFQITWMNITTDNDCKLRKYRNSFHSKIYQNRSCH
jgi:hypothetical protein